MLSNNLALSSIALLGGAGKAGPVTYEGLVASRARPIGSSAFGGNAGTGMVRSAHISTDNITALKIVMGNFNVANPDVTIGSAGQTITASVEYPSGTFTRINFGGLPQGNISSLGLVTSDSTSVTIPIGTLFWIRMYVTGGPGWNGWQNSFLGEAISLQGGAQSDLTMGGTIANNFSASMPPLAIIGQTTKPSVIIVGDSIAFGQNDVEDTSNTATGYNAKVGIIARSLGSIPFLNLSASGITTQGWVTASPGKKLFLTKSSHIAEQIGINDLSAGRTSAQLLSDLATVRAFYGTQKIFRTTITPKSGSTDAWATTGNQTPDASSVAQRTVFNNAVRAGSAGASGFYDVASVLETSQNSDIWIAPPAATTDGTHPTLASYALVPPSGVITAPVYP
jgi:hypothetical protein